VTRIIAAGGETAGSVVSTLAVTGGIVGAEAAPGVPWITTGRLELLFKSGGGSSALHHCVASRYRRHGHEIITLNSIAG
jgi:uncharacterized protein YgbK (DUF1537 family)